MCRKHTQHSYTDEYCLLGFISMTTFTCDFYNNQSKDLIAGAHVQTFFTSIYMQFSLFGLFTKNCGYFTATTQMINSHTVGQDLPANTDLFSSSLASFFSVDGPKMPPFQCFWPSIYCIIFMSHNMSTHAHFGLNGTDVFKVFTCLFITIKNWHMLCLTVIMFAAIHSLFASIWSKYSLHKIKFNHNITKIFMVRFNYHQITQAFE